MVKNTRQIFQAVYHSLESKRFSLAGFLMEFNMLDKETPVPKVLNVIEKKCVQRMLSFHPFLLHAP